MSLSIDPAVAWAGILLAVPLVIAAAFYGGKWAGRKETQLLLPYDDCDGEYSAGTVLRSVKACQPDRDEERLFFFQFTTLALDELPVLLRRFFKQRWEQMGVTGTWTDSPGDGEAFWRGLFDNDPWCAVATTRGSNVVKIVNTSKAELNLAAGDKVKVHHQTLKVMSIKGDRLHLNDSLEHEGAALPLYGQIVGYERNADSRMARHFEPKVLSGDSDKWDISLLTFALLNSSHDLMRGAEEQVPHVVALRNLRNDRLAHVQSCRMAREELEEAMATMNSFVHHCLPAEWQEWQERSRAVLHTQYGLRSSIRHVEIQCEQPPQPSQPQYEQQASQTPQQQQQQQQQRERQQLPQTPHRIQSQAQLDLQRIPSFDYSGAHARAMLSAATQRASQSDIRQQQEGICRRFWQSELTTMA